MAKLKNYNGRYCESEYESAFIAFLQSVGWTYLPGNKIKRCYRDVLIADDFRAFITKANTDLLEEEIEQIYDTVRLVGAESDFATLHKVYKWMVDGIQFTPQSGLPIQVTLIDFETPENNIFHVVNQLTVDYINNGQRENRRPDVLLYVNGMPLCIIELKNPADSHSTIYDAWEQITIRYWRDIPHLLHYCPLACISDGVKTRLGTVRTPYEHFYAWRRVNDADKISTMPFAETETMIKGVYAPERFLEIFRDYIYFQDEIFDCDEREIVCRYPQFFAVRLLKQSIIKSVMEQTGKGGTYFGATGCGKTYTMAFLARQLALRCSDIPEIGSPTIVMIVDRDELQEQGIKLFAKSKEFLNLGEVSIVKSRNNLRQELGSRESGGFYICTIQKFCDRKEDKIGLINDRHNIICFSDEAHRTQLEHSRKIQFSKDADENMKAMVSKPYAKVLKEAFPHATFVGFTGTPIAETYQTFGDEIDRYTMDQAVADGLTVSIKYHPRIAKVLLDTKKVKEIEAYYKTCADDGATEEDIEASKKAMSSMEIILGEPSRLERLAVDIHDHYVSACDKEPDRIQKAMIVCSNRKIAYELLRKFRDKYPEWFEEKKIPDGIEATKEELDELKPMPFMAMVGFIMSLTEYYVERRKAMEEFWLQATKVLNELKKIKYLDVDAPINLIVDAIHEDDSNALKEKFHLLSNDEKISVNAKENLISWYKENIPIPFDENTDDNKELTHLYDSNMAGYKEVFLQCMDSYREASMVELGNLDNAYGNLDFIIANKCIRQKAYEQIYDKLRKIVYQFRNEVYHFNLLKDGNGNFPVCILKVSELNQKYFLSKEKNLQGYTNVSIFQNVFDDIDASLEKFRCKIYRIEYVEPKAIPVSGKTFFNNNEK